MPTPEARCWTFWRACAEAFGAASISSSRSPASFQPLRFLGRYSFGLYVYDEILEQIWSIVIHRHSGLWNRTPTHALGHLAYCFLNLATLVPLAMISFHLYERPFLKLKSFFNYQRTMPSPTADASVR
jgi:peptidoglycan/LPS O-acetylase OafA/YrhL